MKLKTAFKLSALAVALASTSVYAATLDPSKINPEWTDPSNPQGIVDQSEYQYVDVGSKPLVIKDEGQLSDPVRVDEYKLNGQTYYLIEDKVFTPKGETLETSDISKETLLSEGKFNRGGTSDNYEITQTSGFVTKRLDSETLTFAEQTTTSTGKVTGDVSVTNSTGTGVDSFKINDNTTPTEEVTKDSISLGIIAQTKDEQTNETKNTYGVHAETKDANGTSSTTLTSNGLTTTGQVDAAKLTVNGKDVATQEALDAEIADRKKSDDGLMANIKAEAATREDADTALQSSINAEIADRKKSDDGLMTNIKAAADDRAAIRTEFSAADAATLEKAQAADVQVLADAKSYTDAQFSTFNTTTSRLNQRISDVEETAYRGIAIALAAQQQVPNIGAGQFAVFGGVGHYEGESAAALGLASVLADGRTSFSAAVGTAGNGEVGGRVGMAYVFGGK